MTQHEVMDVAEAAALLRVAPEVVVEEAESGRLPGRRVGGRWRFARARLLDWLGGTDAPAATEPADPERLLASTSDEPPTPDERAAGDESDALGEP